MRAFASYPTSRRAVGLGRAMIMACLAGSCVSKELVPDFSSRPAILRLHFASVATDTRSVKVSVRYDRSSGERVALTQQTFDVSGASAPQVTLQIDLTACLGDAAHAGGQSTCQLRAAVALRDGVGVLLDSVEVGPVAAAPGTAPAPANVSLSVVAALAVTGVPALSVKLGDSFTLTAAMKDAAGTEIVGRSVTWTSSNAAVAKVDPAGRVTALTVGTAVITAQSGNAQATATIPVRNLRVDFVRIMPMQVLARYGVSQQLSAKAVGDSGVAVSNVTWQTFDDSTISVDAQGTLRVLRDDDRSIVPICAVATTAVTNVQTIGCTLVRIGSPASSTLHLPNGTNVAIPSPLVDSAIAINNLLDLSTKQPADLSQLDSGRTIIVESYRVVGSTTAGTFAVKSSDTTVIAPNTDGQSWRVKRRSPNPVTLCATYSALPGRETCLTGMAIGPADIRVEPITTWVRGEASDSGQFAAWVRTPSGVSTAVKFSSSEPSKISVDATTGIMRMLAPTTGTAVCASAVADSTRKACAVVRLDPKVAGVTMAPFLDASFSKPIGQRSVLAGSTTYMKGLAFGDAGIDTRVRWSSSDSTLLRVDAATGAMTASTKTGTEAFVCAWPVARWDAGLCMGAYLRAPSVTYASVTPHRTFMYVGESQQFDAHFAEDAPANATVSWSTSDATALSITPLTTNSARVTALRGGAYAGVCITVAKPGAPSYRDCASVRVENVVVNATPPDTLVAITGLTEKTYYNGPAELGSIMLGTQYQINTMTRAATGAVPLSYKSSDVTAATVTSGGLITPLRYGAFPLICAEMTGVPQKWDCITLSITGDANLRIRVAPSAVVMTVGSSLQFGASVDALRGEQTAVSWSSADNSKVTVSASGVVTAVAPTTFTQVCAVVTGTSRRACSTVNVQAVTLPATPATPTLGSTTGPGPVLSSSTVTFTWDAVAALRSANGRMRTLVGSAHSAASSYTLSVLDASTSASVLKVTGINGTTYTTTLEAGRAYKWTVAACNAAGCSNASAPLFFQTPAALPATPTGPAPGSTTAPGPTQSSTSVGLSWASVSGATSYSVVVTDRTTSTTAVSTSVSGTSYSASLTASHSYSWVVSACNAAGCSSPTAALYFQTPSLSVPAVPTGLSPGTPSSPGPLVSGTITFSWSAVSSATYYLIEVRNAITNIAVLNSSSSQATYTTSSLSTGSYTWMVQACNSAGCSAWSTPNYIAH